MAAMPFWEGSRRAGVVLPDKDGQAPAPTEPSLSIRLPPSRLHLTVTATPGPGDV